jgi:hypothetical protein
MADACIPYNSSISEQKWRLSPIYARRVREGGRLNEVYGLTFGRDFALLRPSL